MSYLNNLPITLIIPFDLFLLPIKVDTPSTTSPKSNPSESDVRLFKESNILDVSPSVTSPILSKIVDKSLPLLSSKILVIALLVLLVKSSFLSIFFIVDTGFFLNFLIS